MIRVVQPAYHWAPNGGQGSFLPSASCLFSWDRVFATVRARVSGERGVVGGRTHIRRGM